MQSFTIRSCSTVAWFVYLLKLQYGLTKLKPQPPRYVQCVDAVNMKILKYFFN